MSQNNYLLQVQDLKKYFYKEGFFSADKRPIRAVDGIHFSIRKGETLGLVEKVAAERPLQENQS
jgi:ABC-type oligopeptide transport system ATPase subunit